MTNEIEICVLSVMNRISEVPGGLDLDTKLSDYRVSSVKIMQILASLEAELDFELDDDDLTMDNFATPRKTLQLLASKYFTKESA